VNSESSDTAEPPAPAPVDADRPAESRRIASSRDQHSDSADYSPEYYSQLGSNEGYTALDPVARDDRLGLSLGRAQRDGQRELVEREGPHELRSPDGPRQLPPAE
jgi:hypothetical protein